MTDWASLPNLVRQGILEALAEDPVMNDAGEPVEGSLPPAYANHARYALVSREWLAFFEPRMYRHIFVSDTTVGILDEFGPRQRALVRYIWLNIRFCAYPCTEDDALDAVTAYNRRVVDKAIAQSAIYVLFRILTTWEWSQIESSEGISLEISSSSPSDREHDLSPLLHLNTSPFATGELQRHQRAIGGPEHACVGRGKPGLPDRACLRRIFNSPFFFRLVEGDLPPVRVVTRLILRRQSRRTITEPTLGMVCRRLMRLNSIVYEPWRSSGCSRVMGEYLEDLGYRTIILDCLQSEVRNVVLFEDFNEDYNASYAADPGNSHIPGLGNLVETIRTPSPIIGAALAARSVDLRSLAASYLVDAEDFFSACKEAWTWERLEVLCLTSRYFVPSTAPSRVNQMLNSAGAAAIHMPNLRKMAIWNGTRNNACSFKYEVVDDYGIIQWLGTWMLDFNAEVIRTWETVGEAHHRGLRLPRQEFVVSDVPSHAAAIRCLGLGEHVAHRVSLKQILAETAAYIHVPAETLPDPEDGEEEQPAE